MQLMFRKTVLQKTSKKKYEHYVQLIQRSTLQHYTDYFQSKSRKCILKIFKSIKMKICSYNYSVCIGIFRSFADKKSTINISKPL